MFWTVLNKKITYQSLWDIDKAIVKSEMCSFECHVRKAERSQINNLSFHPKTLGEKRAN